MTGSTPFSIEPSDNFVRSLKKLTKNRKDNLVKRLEQILEDLTENQYPFYSRHEPLPKKAPTI